MADQTVREVGTLSYLLHPPMLDETGLADAVQHYQVGGTLELDSSDRDIVSQSSHPSVTVIRLLVQGKSNKEFASSLGIAPRTAETHRSRIMLKLGLHSLAELVAYASRHSLMPSPGATAAPP